MSGISQRILVIGPSWVGDMIMAQSLFKTIKQQSADSLISVLAPGWTHPVLNRMPEVSEAIVMPVGHGKLDFRSRLNMASEIKNHQFDQSIVLPGSLKSALIPFLAKIPKRTGYLGEQRYGLLNDIYKLDKHVLPTTVQRFVNLSGEQMSLASCPKPDLSINLASAQEVANDHEYKKDQPLLVLCPGAEYGSAKRWPAQRHAELARNRHQQGWQVWLMGSEKDREICNIINSLSDDCCNNLAGETSLTQAIDLMSLADIVVTNDSGLMHLAAALNRPLVAIYGSSSPNMTPPLSDNAEVVWLQPDCGPCFKRDCPLGHLKCLNDIDSMQVDQAISKLSAVH